MVEPLVATRPRIAALWQQLEEFPYLRQQMEIQTPEKLLARLEDRRAVFFENPEHTVMLAALHIQPGQDATVYLVAWDHQLSGREPWFRDALRELFIVAKLRRVTMVTPDDMRVVLKLARRLGFAWEGILRRGWEHGDLHVNGLLAEELDAA